MTHIFTIIFYQPILNLLVWLYDIIPGHDIGIAIILLTIIIKLILEAGHRDNGLRLKGRRAFDEIPVIIDIVHKQVQLEGGRELILTSLTSHLNREGQPFTAKDTLQDRDIDCLLIWSKSKCHDSDSLFS